MEDLSLFEKLQRIPCGWLLYHTQSGYWRIENDQDGCEVEGADLESVLDDMIELLEVRR